MDSALFEKTVHSVILVFAALVALNMAINIWQQMSFYFATNDLHGQIGLTGIILSFSVLLPSLTVVICLLFKKRSAIWAMAVLALTTFGGSLLAVGFTSLFANDSAYHDTDYTTVNWGHLSVWLGVYGLMLLGLIWLTRRGWLT